VEPHLEGTLKPSWCEGRWPGVFGGELRLGGGPTSEGSLSRQSRLPLLVDNYLVSLEEALEKLTEPSSTPGSTILGWNFLSAAWVLASVSF
jgi:hypothetical protein